MLYNPCIHEPNHFKAYLLTRMREPKRPLCVIQSWIWQECTMVNDDFSAAVCKHFCCNIEIIHGYCCAKTVQQVSEQQPLVFPCSKNAISPFTTIHLFYPELSPQHRHIPASCYVKVIIFLHPLCGAVLPS